MAAIAMPSFWVGCSKSSDEFWDDGDDFDNNGSGKGNSGSAGNTSSSVSNADGTINGYGDLGLSIKWATCNYGASSPEGYGTRC